MSQSPDTIYPALPDDKEILYDGGDSNDALPINKDEKEKAEAESIKTDNDKPKPHGLVEDDNENHGIIGNEGSHPIAGNI